VDPSFDEALQLAKADPELARWFRGHCETTRLLREKFQSLPVPVGLQEQILSERKIRRPFLERYWAPLLAAAAAAALLLSVDSGFRPIHGLSNPYAAYRKRMTETALRNYSMDLIARDPQQIHHFLESKNAPADFTLPARLQATPLAGCVVSTWQNGPVAMICFKSGRPLPPGDRSDLWLFVTDRKTVPTAPPPGPPVFARVNKAATVSWSDDQKNYLLAAVGNEAFLRQYLQ
jgi:hypothetical protein